MDQKQLQLDQIKLDMLEHQVCAELAASATNLVMGEGNPDAEIVFIGEAPGKKEDQEGRPFVGASGRMLNQLLASIGLERNDIFITNIVKYRPPANRDPRPAEIAASIPYLDRQLAIIRPKLIAFLGRHAMNVFLPDLKISQVHGTPVRKGGQVYLPLFHPAAALYNPGMRETLASDFAGIPAIMQQFQ